MHADLATFALRFNLTPAEAVVLPALFDKAAAGQSMQPRALVNRAIYDARVGEYLADCARRAAAAL